MSLWFQIRLKSGNSQNVLSNTPAGWKHLFCPGLFVFCLSEWSSVSHYSTMFNSQWSKLLPPFFLNSLIKLVPLDDIVTRRLNTDLCSICMSRWKKIYNILDQDNFIMACERTSSSGIAELFFHCLLYQITHDLWIFCVLSLADRREDKPFLFFSSYMFFLHYCLLFLIY